MATGKNLQSIPKKVKCGGACETGPFPRNGGAEALSLGGGGDQDGASIRMPPIQRGRGGAGLGRPSGGGQLLFLCPRACPFTEELVESARPRGHRLGVTAPPPCRRPSTTSCSASCSSSASPSARASSASASRCRTSATAPGRETSPTAPPSCCLGGPHPRRPISPPSPLPRGPGELSPCLALAVMLTRLQPGSMTSPTGCCRLRSSLPP